MFLSQQSRRQTHRVSAPRAAASTRERLVEAAGHVFAERGYHATTVREIVKRSGANIAAVNYHFGGKLGLYTEVLQQLVRAARVNAIHSALDQNAPPEETLRAVIGTRLQGVTRPDLQDLHFRIVMHELVQPTPALSRIVNEVTRPIYERILELVGRIIDLPPENEKTRLCVNSIMGQMLVYILARIVNEVTRPIYERILELVGRIIDLPPKNEKTRLCVNSIMGQMLVYILAGPLLMRLWPELEMTPAQVDRIAKHIGDFSLTYLRQANSDGRQATVPSKRGRK